MTVKPSILNALKKSTDIQIRFDTTTLALIPHLRVKSAGGVVKVVPQTPRAPQTFLLEPVGATLGGITGTGGGLVQTEGASAHSWAYTLTGRFDCEMEIGDQWSNGETTYRITALQPFNGYSKVGVVSALGKDPQYGS